jgi:hypothetical protein
MEAIVQQVKYASVACGTGDNEIVALVTGKKIRVLGYVLSPAGAVVCKFQSNGVAELSNEIQFVGAVLAPFSSGWNPGGHFETVMSEPLVLNLSAAVTTGCHVAYIEV